MSNNDQIHDSTLLSRHELLTNEMARLRQSINQSINQSKVSLVNNLSQLNASLQSSITHIYAHHIEQNKLSSNPSDGQSEDAELRAIVHSINQRQSRDFLQPTVKIAQQLTVEQSLKLSIDQSKIFSVAPPISQLIDQCEWWTCDPPLTFDRAVTPPIKQSSIQNGHFTTPSLSTSNNQSIKSVTESKISAWPTQATNGLSNRTAGRSITQRNFPQPIVPPSAQSNSQMFSQPISQPIIQTLNQSAHHPLNQAVNQSPAAPIPSLSFQSFAPPIAAVNDQTVNQSIQPTQPTPNNSSSQSARSSPTLLHPTRPNPSRGAIARPADPFVRPPPSKYREQPEHRETVGNGRSNRAADNPWTRSKPVDRRQRDYDDEEAPQRGSRKRAAHSDSDEEVDQHFRSRRPQRSDSDRGADDAPARRNSPFISGLDKLAVDAAKKGQRPDAVQPRPAASAQSKTRKFNPPRPIGSNLDGQVNPMVAAALKGPSSSDDPYAEFEPAIAERLRAFDPKLVEAIRREEMETSRVTWDDVAGLEFAKAAVKEAVILPMKRPDLFTGIREPPKGMLLFGPPGTGKTLIGQAMASEAGAKFYSISASSLTSKWHGEGEKLVRTLFGVAACFPPAIIFIDEIDSLLTARTDSEFEASRRMKTELLVQMEGATSKSDDRVLVLGATNRPQDLDDAAKRRLVKRLYIPLPNKSARLQLMCRALNTVQHTITNSDFDMIAQRTRGYSGADLKSLCREAAMEPLRCMSQAYDSTDTPRAVTVEDLLKASSQVKASVATKDLEALEQWDKAYGMQVKHEDD